MRSEQVGAVGMTELQDSFRNLSLALNMLQAVHDTCAFDTQAFPHRRFPKHLLCNIDMPITYCYA